MAAVGPRGPRAPSLAPRRSLPSNPSLFRLPIRHPARRTACASILIALELPHPRRLRLASHAQCHLAKTAHEEARSRLPATLPCRAGQDASALRIECLRHTLNGEAPSCPAMVHERQLGCPPCSEHCCRASVTSHHSRASATAYMYNVRVWSVHSLSLTHNP